MGKIVKDRIIYGGIDSALQNKVGSAPLDTVAQDLSGAVNELKASGGGTITDVQVDGVSVVSSGVADIDLTGKADAATTLSGYGITDANINNGTITLGSNTITPLTSHQDISGKVNKAGDTMTGSLTISNSLLGSCILKNNSYTINTSSNNGVSSFTGNNFEMQDSASTISTKFGNYLSSDGSVEAIISAHNKKTNGTSISNSLEIKIAKDGTKSYSVSDPAAFRSAVGAVSAADGIVYGGTLSSSETINLNDAQFRMGNARTIYWLQIGSKTSNAPISSGYGNLECHHYMQRFTTYSSGRTYIRWYVNSSWTTWQEINTTYTFAEGSTDGAFSVTPSGGSASSVKIHGLGTMAYASTGSYVAKAGDTMSGDLTISVNGEGIISTKSTAWGMNTSSNNGLSQNASAGAFYHKDKNNNMVARTNCYGQSDGQTVICIQSYNRTTSNAEVMTGLWIWSKKNGAHAYSVTDAAAFRTAINAAASSSRAYKENIQNMTEEEAKKILNVNIYSYDYKDGFGENNHNKNQFGVIAEEVIEQIPYAVNIPDKYDEEEALKSSNDPSKGGRNLITIDYWKFVPHLIKTIQIQEKRINELEEEIKAIKETII